ncbi:MAG: hypothetical protein ACRDJU_09550 [Actinomycetota bacterium]
MGRGTSSARARTDDVSTLGATELVAAGLADATRRAYAGELTRYGAWCTARGWHRWGPIREADADH